MCHKALRTIVPSWRGLGGSPEPQELISYHSCPNCGYRIRTSTFDSKGQAHPRLSKSAPSAVLNAPDAPNNENEDKAKETTGDALPQGLMAELLLNNTPTPQLIMSADNTVLFGNRAAEKLLLFDEDPTTASATESEDEYGDDGYNSEATGSRADLSTPARRGTAKSLRNRSSAVMTNASFGIESDAPLTLKGTKLADLPIKLADVSARRWISVEAVLETVKRSLMSVGHKMNEDVDDAEGWRGEDDAFYNSFYDEVGNTDYTQAGSTTAIRRGGGPQSTGTHSARTSAAPSLMSKRKRKEANRRIATEYIAVSIEKEGEIPVRVNMFVSVVAPGGGIESTVTETYTAISFVAAQLHLMGEESTAGSGKASLVDFDQRSISVGSSRKKSSARTQLGGELVKTIYDVKDQILDEMPYCFMSTTPDRKTLITNKATRSILGELDLTESDGVSSWVDELEFWNEDFTARIPTEEFPLVSILKNPYQTAQQRFGFYAKPDGRKVILEVRGKALWKEGSPMNSELLASLVILLDQTSSVNAENDLRQAGKTKSAFMLNIGMGLRAPIAGMVGLLEYLYRETGSNLTTEQKVMIRNIFKSINSLLLVVNDIVDYTKLENNTLKVLPVPFNFTYVVHDIQKLFTTTFRKEDVAFSVDVSKVQVVPPSRKLDLLAGHDEEEEDMDLVLVGDGQKLRRILINLLDTAFNFTSEGSISLKVKTDWRSEEAVKVRFEITDTGSGLPSDVISSILQPFNIAISGYASSISGHHLGLTIANALARELKGELTCNSIQGVGTTMVLILPFGIPPRGTVVAGSLPGDCLSRTMGIVMKPEDFWQDDDPELGSADTPSYRQSGHMGLPTRRASHQVAGSIETRMTQDDLSRGDQEDSPSTTKPSVTFDESEIERLEMEKRQLESTGPLVPANKVLIVESNWAHGVIMEKRLRKMGFEVKAVTSGEKALNTMRQKEFLPNIVFMDLEMPYMNGYQCTHKIRTSRSLEHISGVTVVAITATQGDESRNVALNAGMDDFMFKPLSDDQLTSTMSKWVDYVAVSKDRKKKRVKVLTEDGEVKSIGDSEARRSVVSLDEVAEAVISKVKNMPTKASANAPEEETRGTTEATPKSQTPTEEKNWDSKSIRSVKDLSAKIPDAIPEVSEFSTGSAAAGSVAAVSVSGKSEKAADTNELKGASETANSTHTVTKSDSKAVFNFPSNMNFSSTVQSPGEDVSGTRTSGTRTPAITSSVRKRLSRAAMNTRRRSSVTPSRGSIEITSDDPGPEVDKNFIDSLHQRMKETVDDRDTGSDRENASSSRAPSIKSTRSKRTSKHRRHAAAKKQTYDSDTSVDWGRKFSATSESDLKGLSDDLPPSSSGGGPSVPAKKDSVEVDSDDSEEYDFPMML